MSKKSNKRNVVEQINTVLDTTRKTAKQTNDFALHTTEEFVLGTIEVAGQWQKVTDKALKGGLKLMANQQDLVFTTLETFKGQMINTKNRLTKIFA